MIVYRVLKREEFLSYKLSYDIEVDLVEGRLPTREELREVATKLCSKRHDKTFVCFYLPGMILDRGAFATGHSAPQLQVRVIPSMIPDQYKRLNA